MVKRSPNYWSVGDTFHYMKRDYKIEAVLPRYVKAADLDDPHRRKRLIRYKDLPKP